VTKRRKTMIGLVMLALAAVLGLAGFAWFGMAGRGPTQPPQNDMTIDQATRSAVIEAAIADLARAYVYPEIANAMGRQLRAGMRAGRFDAVTSAEKFADVLTETLQRESHDRHLEVRYFEKAVPEPSPDQNGSSIDEDEHLYQLRRNFGIESVGRFPGNIGYLDLHAFGRPQHVLERIAAAMTLLSDTSALIIDLRKCGGGDPETVMLFASYLFDQRTHLNDIYFRDENRTEERWTTDAVAGRKYGGARKIYLLTSGDTFSGCEDFAYALKNAGRASLVGETTGGGAYAGSPQRLSAHFMMFVPSGRPINPITHTDWEGVGVQPDVKVSAKRALDAGQVAALKDLIGTETDADWKRRLQEQLANLN
jgi:Peptidase family S41/N-terminal domain of Peptidase_S41 in eukaryotic IRBP